MQKLTAIIPTGNEEHNIVEAIQSLSFADEILVVDSFSSDKTIELAKPLATKIIQREYQNSASQKNWAIPQAKYEWILLLDADERITNELADEIEAELPNLEQMTDTATQGTIRNHINFLRQAEFDVKHSPSPLNWILKDKIKWLDQYLYRRGKTLDGLDKRYIEWIEDLRIHHEE